jgi:hypothetical protein
VQFFSWAWDYESSPFEEKNKKTTGSLNHFDFHNWMNFPCRRAPWVIKAVIAEILNSRTHVCASVVVVIP